MTPASIPWDLAAILGVLAILVPWRGRVRVRELLARDSLRPADRLSIYASTIAFQWVAVTITAWRCYVRGWDPVSLGLSLRQPLVAIGLGCVLAALLAMLQIISLQQFAKAPEQRSGIFVELTRKLMPQTLMEIFPFIALVCTVSLCEEFLYRGFAFAVFERAVSGFGQRVSVAAGILCSSVLFGVAHLYQGRRGVTSTSVLGALFAGTRAWSGSLAPGILAHGVVDLVAGLIAPRVFFKASDGSTSN